jgi:hypothetical protein
VIKVVYAMCKTAGSEARKRARRRLKKKANEFRFLPKFLKHIDDDITTEFVENAIYWYVLQANMFKALFYTFSVLSILCGASVPIINSLPVLDDGAKLLVSSIVAVSGSVCISICSLFNCKEAWRRNRVAAEKIKRESFCYLKRIEKYTVTKKMNPELLQNLFSNNILKIISDEGFQWEQSQKQINPTDYIIKTHNESDSTPTNTASDTPLDPATAEATLAVDAATGDAATGDAATGDAATGDTLTTDAAAPIYSELQS